MKKHILLGAVFLLTGYSIVIGQDIEGMSKSELRDFIYRQNATIDKLTTESVQMDALTNQIRTRLNECDRKLIAKDADIESINKQLTNCTLEKQKAAEAWASERSKFNEKIAELEASLNAISPAETSTPEEETSPVSTSNDFLNNYFFNQQPLNNNNFKLSLIKVIYGKMGTESRYYDQYGYHGAVERAPELLNTSAVTFWTVRPNVELSKNMKVEELLIKKNASVINEVMPQVEVLKNKLFTIKYNNGSDESFLFNTKIVSDEKGSNNQRKVLQIELANEEVKEDGTNNQAKDIVWRIFVIDQDCYLALSIDQLHRLGINLNKFDSEVEMMDKNGNKRRNGLYYSEGKKTTGSDIFISRTKDRFMDDEKFFNPDELLYLFKWTPN